jgi:hypothetical protein
MGDGPIFHKIIGVFFKKIGLSPISGGGLMV